MIKRKFICRDCGHQFVIDRLEPGEAEQKKIRPIPVRCPQCGSASLERR